MSAATEHLASALAYINYMTSAKAMKQMAWGADKFAVTNAKVKDLLTADQVKALGLDMMEGMGLQLRNEPGAHR